jgi:hypothetical protein
MHAGSGRRKPEEKDNLEGLGVDARIILKQNLKTYLLMA